MADSAALLVDDILPHKPMRQLSPGMACIRAMQEQLPRVLSVPFPLRFLFASQPAVMGKVLGIVYRAIATHLIHQAGYTKATAQAGAVTLIQCFGGALNANIHFHMIFLDGVFIDGAAESRVRFRWVKAPTSEELNQLMLDGCRVFHDIPFPYGNIDHVVVSRSGVYSVNAKMCGKPKEGGSVDVVVDHGIYPYRTEAGVAPRGAVVWAYAN